MEILGHIYYSSSCRATFLASLSFDAHLFSPWIFWTEGWVCWLHAILLTEELHDNTLTSGKHWHIVYLNAFFKFRQKGALFNHKGIHTAFIVQYKLSRIICYTKRHPSIVNRNYLDLLSRRWKVSANKLLYKYNQNLMFRH